MSLVTMRGSLKQGSDMIGFEVPPLQMNFVRLISQIVPLDEVSPRISNDGGNQS